MRYRVHLAVRYGSAQEFVREYAENLSAGGLFIPDAHNLNPRQEVTVELSLPGFGAFKLRCEAAHILDPATAARFDRRPGAGLAIRRAPANFTEALQAYLVRLGSRADAIVLACDERCGSVVAEAGYQVQPCPEPGGLAEVYARTDGNVIALLAPSTRAADYRAACANLGAGDIVVTMDYPGEIDRVLERLDREL